MKKKFIVFISVLFSCFALAGCGSQIELSNENSELIAQYAAGILLKYDKNYNEGLSDTTLLEDESIKSEDAETIDDTVENENNEIVKSTEELENIDVLEEDTDPQPAKSLNEGLNLNGFDFTYTNHEFAEYYPNNGVYENMDYVVNPRVGNQLFILNFSVKNTESEIQKLDLFSLNPQFDVVLNSDTRSKAIKTVLLNDLSTISVDVEPGGTLETVLLYEVPHNLGKEISSINLEINMNQVTTSVVLK